MSQKAWDVKGNNSFTQDRAELDGTDVAKVPKGKKHVAKPFKVEHNFIWNRLSRNGQEWVNAKSFETLAKAEAWVKLMNERDARSNPGRTEEPHYRVSPKHYPEGEQDASHKNRPQH